VDGPTSIQQASAAAPMLSRLLLPAPVSPQSIGVRAPVFRVTRFGPQLNLVPLLIGTSALSPPGQKLFASHLLHRVLFGAGS
jgi:hypothetical protein